MNTTPTGIVSGRADASESTEPLERPTAKPTPQQRERAKWLAGAAHDRKALDLVVLDAREVSSFADTFVLATGTSNRHARAVADAVREAAQANDETPIGTEGYDEGRWILLDFGDTIIHIFTRDVREYYDLERLWSDAPLLDLGLADDAKGASGAAGG